ncbi:MAG: thermonuclease family protein [Candidatus Cloacimonetes bacterium]|nr:thermonuclease family protein [Candidatus Cloacimonadota bacterium]
MKYVLIAIGLIIIILGLVTCPQAQPAEELPGYPVLRVVDGDTFICEMEGIDTRIRLIGVDTPESVHPNKEVEYFAIEASNFLKKLLEGEKVFFEYDATNNSTGHKDRYGRTLAYAYRSRDSLFINAEIIKQGYGHAYTSYPFQYMENFLKYERDARVQQVGLWAELESGESGEPTENDTVMVYFTPSTKKYHRQSCRYVTEKSTAIPKSEAIAKGMEACKICSP